MPATRLPAQAFSFSAGGGLVSLTIDTAVPGSEPGDAANSDTELYWDADFAGTSKITVSTICPSQSFSLYVALAVTSWGSGTQATVLPDVSLVNGMMAVDLVRDLPDTLPARQGYATVTYRAAATISQGNSADVGEDYHTITYTIQSQ
jgi:hypothetical protein